MSSTSWLYSDEVKDHFTNPRNILEDEENFQEDGRGMVGSMACGDQMLVLIKVENDAITDCRWKTYGCASAIASTSLMSEMVKGMTLEEAYRLSPGEITEGLGGLPTHKFHCSVLGDKALRAAIDDYLERSSRENKLKGTIAVTVCECMDISDQDIETMVKQGARTYEELQKRSGIGTKCGKCKERTLELLEQFNHMFPGEGPHAC